MAFEQVSGSKRIKVMQYSTESATLVIPLVRRMERTDLRRLARHNQWRIAKVPRNDIRSVLLHAVRKQQVLSRHSSNGPRCNCWGIIKTKES
jgi:hypothetical protein